MDLDEYLWRNKIPQIEFAERIGVTQRTISMVVRRVANIQLSTAKKIVDGSNGEITYEELLRIDKSENKI